MITLLLLKYSLVPMISTAIPIIGMNNKHNISASLLSTGFSRSVLVPLGEQREICLVVESLKGLDGGVYPIVLFELHPSIGTEKRTGLVPCIRVAVLGLLTSPDNPRMCVVELEK